MENKWASVITNFIVRAVLGMGLIFFINQYLLPNENTLNVGMNAITFLTTGSLGIPGVCLLYGVLFYQSL